MTKNVWTLVLLGAGAMTAGLALTALGRIVALRVGAVCHPRRDRWSAAPVPLFGGPAIVLTTVAGMLLLPMELPSSLWILLAGACVLSLVGLADDLRPITPYTKLTAQLATAGLVTAFGLGFPLTGTPVVDVLVTVAWIVALSNAFNLLDNMDGLAAGIAAITGVVKLVLFVMEGQWPAAFVSAVFVGACAGFLLLNFHPARIFMGDAGSMFLGFFVAGLSTIGVTPDSRVTMSVLVAPVAVMLVPIFDTVFVTILRIRAGRPISQGGRDHTSHRLVTAGLSERRAVLTLYGLAAASGVIAIVTRGAGLGVGLALFAALGLVTLFLGITLARIKIYQTDRVLPETRVQIQGAPGLPYVRQVATAAIDGLLVLLAFYAAWAFSRGTASIWTGVAFVEMLPIVFSAKMIALAIFRSTSRVWRYTNSHDLLALASSSAIGSAGAMSAVLLVFGDGAGSTALFVLDGMLLTGLLATSRLLMKGLSEVLRPAPHEAARVLIYGAGDAGVTLLQELRNNRALGRVVVGFMDDDPSKARTRIQGLPVLGGAGMLREALRRRSITEVIVATSKLPASRVEEIVGVCESVGVLLSRFRVAIHNVPRRGHLHGSGGSVEPARTA